MLQFLHTLTQGGPVMVPLLACSLVAVSVIIERALVLRRAGAPSDLLMLELRRLLDEGRASEALEAARRNPGPVACVLAGGISAWMAGKNPEAAMEEEALAQLPALNYRLSVLDTIVTISPLLGLLGTVTGMIGSFGIIARTGTSHPAGITAGIAEALIATATGLVIAIISLIGYNHFTERVKGVTTQMELRATQLGNYLAALRKERDPVALETARA